MSSLKCGRMATEKWAREKDALRNVQIHFAFQQEVIACIRHDAADNNINPSDIIRKIVDLPYTKIQRARIGISFNQQELDHLAKRYGLGDVDEKEIKRRVMEEINMHYHELDRA